MKKGTFPKIKQKESILVRHKELDSSIQIKKS